MSTLRSLQSSLFRAQCELVFQMVEQQSSLGITHQELGWMPRPLVQLLPVKTQTFEWRGLLKRVRVFDPVQAQVLLRLLDFPDFPMYLKQYGYEQSKQEFLSRLSLHVQSEQAKLMSLF